MSGMTDFTSTSSTAPEGLRARTSIEPRSPRTLNVTSGCEPADRPLDEPRVRNIEQAVHPFALPKESNDDRATELDRNTLQRRERDLPGVASLYPGDRRSGRSDLLRERSLGEPRSSTECTKRKTEPDGFHYARVPTGGYRALTRTDPHVAVP